jgi:hypothetical protein
MGVLGRPNPVKAKLDQEALGVAEESLKAHSEAPSRATAE